MFAGKKMGFICAISILIALLIEIVTAMMEFPYSNLDTMEYKLDDFIFHECEVNPAENTIITTGYDPSLYISFPEIYTQSIKITFGLMPEKQWKLQVYYGESNESLSEENSVINFVSDYSDEYIVRIDKNIGKLRIDLGIEPERTFKIESVKINPWGRNIHYISVILETISRFRIFTYAIIFVCIALCGTNIYYNPSFGNFIKKYFCAISFCAIILLEVAVMDHSTRSPSLYDSNGKADIPSYTEAYETWINDNIGYRQQLIDLRSIISYKILGFSPSEQISIGKHGWLFYTGNDNIEIAKGTYPMDWDDYIETASSVQKIKDLLNSQGIDFIIASPCSKVSIYPEYLPGKYDVISTPADYFKEAIEYCTNVDLIYLKDILLDAKQDGQIYYKTDTHWNYKGALSAYQAIYDFLYLRGYVSNSFPEIYVKSGQRNGDIGNMMGSESVIPDEEDDIIHLSAPSAYVVERGPIYDTLMELKELHNIREIRTYRNSTIHGKKLLIFGDSFFEGWNMPEYFAENFSEVTYVWSANIFQDIINACQPDLIIYEKGERELQYLNTFTTQYLANGIIK